MGNCQHSCWVRILRVKIVGPIPKWCPFGSLLADGVLVVLGSLTRRGSISRVDTCGVTTAASDQGAWVLFPSSRCSRPGTCPCPTSPPCLEACYTTWSARRKGARQLRCGEGRNEAHAEIRHASAGRGRNKTFTMRFSTCLRGWSTEMHNSRTWMVFLNPKFLRLPSGKSRRVARL